MLLKLISNATQQVGKTGPTEGRPFSFSVYKAEYYDYVAYIIHYTIAAKGYPTATRPDQPELTSNLWTVRVRGREKRQTLVGRTNKIFISNELQV